MYFPASHIFDDLRKVYLPASTSIPRPACSGIHHRLRSERGALLALGLEGHAAAAQRGTAQRGATQSGQGIQGCEVGGTQSGRAPGLFQWKLTENTYKMWGPQCR